jgi:hypothetical protein
MSTSAKVLRVAAAAAAPKTPQDVWAQAGSGDRVHLGNIYSPRDLGPLLDRAAANPPDTLAQAFGEAKDSAPVRLYVTVGRSMGPFEIGTASHPQDLGVLLSTVAEAARQSLDSGPF